MGSAVLAVFWDEHCDTKNKVALYFPPSSPHLMKISGAMGVGLGLPSLGRSRVCSTRVGPCCVRTSESNIGGKSKVDQGNEQSAVLILSPRTCDPEADAADFTDKQLF